MTDTTFVANPGQISSGLSEETIILDLESGVYHSLNNVGSSVWQLIQQPQTLNSICSAIAGEYDVEPRQCETDVRELLAKLSDAGLVEAKESEPA